MTCDSARNAISASGSIILRISQIIDARSIRAPARVTHLTDVPSLLVVVTGGLTPSGVALSSGGGVSNGVQALSSVLTTHSRSIGRASARSSGGRDRAMHRSTTGDPVAQIA